MTDLHLSNQSIGFIFLAYTLCLILDTKIAQTSKNCYFLKICCSQMFLPAQLSYPTIRENEFLYPTLIDGSHKSGTQRMKRIVLHTLFMIPINVTTLTRITKYRMII